MTISVVAGSVLSDNQHHASLTVLHQMLDHQGTPHPARHLGDQNWNSFEPALSNWILRSARSLAHAIVSASAVIDFEGVIIDGALPQDVRSRLARLLESRLSQIDLGGIPYPVIAQGSFGTVARAVGAAAVHINERYMVRQEPVGI